MIQRTMQERVEVVDGRRGESSSQAIGIQPLYVGRAELAQTETPDLTDDVQAGKVTVPTHGRRPQRWLNGLKPPVKELADRDLPRIDKAGLSLLDELGCHRFDFALRA